ncbi:Phosphoesterase PA-phosphatase-like protein [Erwinia sp. Ejp617]|nr:phosphatase PAP2 family protein [Erwinia sp. Ejp617]ADP12997.1 Phosphoesterase PA-phosphatase-like protein [Erwinia sp. Ejp617]
MFWPLIHFLTYLGDSMLLLPTALIIALLLFWKSDDERSAWYWLLTFCTAGALVSLSKIAFMGYGIGSARFNFTGFSGHSAMSATLWPVMLWLMSARLSGGWRRVAIIIGYFIPLCVGVSRLALHYHSDSEVISGLLLGFTLSSVYLIGQRHNSRRTIPTTQLCLVLIVPLLLISQGRKATTQQFLQHISAQIAGIEQAWTREKLLKLSQ